MPFFKKTSYTAAVYLRISRDDGDKAESDSIQNQRELIKEFLKNHPEITKTREFADDGYSGTNFDRPSFIRMMTEIEKGRINCIVVKDLSRLGRNYIETGRYLERIFPMLDVRFLSVNDNYDSEDKQNDADQIIIPFKNLINDAYCRDISVKIRSQLDVKRKNGKFIGSFAAYGYRKNPKNKNQLIIDEYPAEIVRSIFDMKLEGLSAGKIADRLNELEVLTPMEYKKACGFNYNSGYHTTENPIWNAVSVTRILTNEVYTGMCVQGKTRKINYKVKESVQIEPEKWIRVSGTHEAIIPKSIFDRVQSLLLLDTRAMPGVNHVSPFSGLIRCGDCKQNMVKRSSIKNGKRYYYYHCTTYKNGLGCTSHLISEERLYDAVFYQVRRQISELISAKELLQKLSHLPSGGLKTQMLDRQIDTLKSEVSRYTELKEKLYQDMVDETITKEDYAELNARFGHKIDAAKKAQTDIESQKVRLSVGKIQEQKWVRDLEQYGEIIEIDRKTAVALIDKIIVYDKERIEIVFRYQDEMNLLLSVASECEQPIGKEKAI